MRSSSTSLGGRDLEEQSFPKQTQRQRMSGRSRRGGNLLKTTIIAKRRRSWLGRAAAAQWIRFGVRSAEVEKTSGGGLGRDKAAAHASQKGDLAASPDPRQIDLKRHGSSPGGSGTLTRKIVPRSSCQRSSKVLSLHQCIHSPTYEITESHYMPSDGRNY
ncbi:unnamed protein product, partial [Iphiclides podalirius]